MNLVDIFIELFGTVVGLHKVFNRLSVLLLVVVGQPHIVVKVVIIDFVFAHVTLNLLFSVF